LLSSIVAQGFGFQSLAVEDVDLVAFDADQAFISQAVQDTADHPRHGTNLCGDFSLGGPTLSVDDPLIGLF